MSSDEKQFRALFSIIRDSGGPLVRKEGNGRWEQVGIVSFGSTNCEEGAPDGFTQVNLFLDWIEEQTGIIPPKKAEQ